MVAGDNETRKFGKLTKMGGAASLASVFTSMSWYCQEVMGLACYKAQESSRKSRLRSVWVAYRAVSVSIVSGMV